MRMPTCNCSPYASPMAMTLLALASWETIMVAVSFLMVQGTKVQFRRSTDEWQRKRRVALQMSTAAFIGGARPDQAPSWRLWQPSAGKRQAVLPSKGMTAWREYVR